MVAPVSGDSTVDHFDLAPGTPADGSVVSDDDQGNTARVECFQCVDNGQTGILIQVTGRFIGEQHRRFGDGGTRNCDTLALAAG